MASKTYTNKMFEQTEILSGLVHERFIAEGKSFETSSLLVAGYMHSFLVNLLCENVGQKEKLAMVQIRINMQKEAIANLTNV